MSKISAKEFSEYIADKFPNLKLISEYRGSQYKVQVQYQCGCINNVRADTIKRSGSTCKVHDRYNYTSTEDFKKYLSKIYPDLELISEYKNTRSKVTIQYPCGCTKDLIPANLKNSGIGSICRACAGHVNKTSPELFATRLSVRYPDLEPATPYITCQEYFMVRSKTCLHEWVAVPNDLMSHGTNSICRVCNPANVSSGEKELIEFIQSNYNGWIELGDRSILGGKELDIILPDLGLAFEYNGMYWHSDVQKTKHYHSDKTDAVKAFGYKLIHVFEDEWLYTKDIVKSRVLALLGKAARIYARNCTVKEVKHQEASVFLGLRHLRGAGAPAKYNIGLYLGDRLVALQTFSTPKTAASCEFELVRYCSDFGTTVVGGASKLLKYFINKYNPKSIVSYSDRCWSNGGLYKTLGFMHTHTTSPGYSYYKKGGRRESRYKFQKHKLKDLFPETYSDSKTEFEIMDEAGYLRIFDSGNDVWVLNNLHS